MVLGKLFFLHCIFLSICCMSSFHPVWLCQLCCLLALESFFFFCSSLNFIEFIWVLWCWLYDSTRHVSWTGSQLMLEVVTGADTRCSFCLCTLNRWDNVGLDSFQIDADVTDRCSLCAIWKTLFLYISFVRLQSAYKKVGQTPGIVQKVSCCSWLQPTLLPSSSHFLGCSILLQH